MDNKISTWELCEQEMQQLPRMSRIGRELVRKLSGAAARTGKL